MNRRPLACALAALTLALVAGCGKSEPPPPPAYTVDVSVGTTIDPTLGAELRAAFVKHLVETGLEVVPGGTPAFARVTLDIASQRERDGAAPGTAAFEVSFTARAKTASGAVSETSQRFLREDGRAVDVADWAVATAAEALAIDVAAWLVPQPELAELLARAGKVRRGAPSALFSTQVLVPARAERVQAFDAFCKAEGERLSAATKANPRGMQCVGDPCGTWSLVTPSADGKSAWVQLGDRAPLFELSSHPQTRWIERPEALALVQLQPGTKPEVRYRTTNIYGIAEPSGDGSRIAAVSFAASDRPALTLLDSQSGKVLRAIVRGADARAGWALPLPGDGGAVLFDGDQALLVGPGEPTAMPALSRIWRAPAGLVAKLDDGRLARLDGQGRVAATIPFEGTIVSLLDTGKEILVVEDTDGDGCTLARIGSPPAGVGGEGALVLESETPVYECVRELQRLSDGRLVGVVDMATPGDPGHDDEVVLLDDKSGRATPLTADDMVEEFVRVAGTRVVFNRRLGDWPADMDLEVYRRDVCWIDLAP
ncbi:MAG: hypothetical protein U1F43_35395 [Myxococcota bacterium]